MVGRRTVGAQAVAAGPAAIDALAAAVVRAKEGDPLAPVTVIAPGNIPRLTIRRSLGRSGPGVANINVTTLRDIADAHAREAGIETMPAGLWEEATRIALAADPGPFAAVASHPATIERVAGALRRLHRLPAADRHAVGTGTKRHAALLRLLTAVESATGRWADGHDVATAATEAARSAPPQTPVIAFAPRPSGSAHDPLLAAVASEVVCPVVGDRAADEPALDLASTLTGMPIEPPHIGPPAPTRIVVASDAEAEARIAVRAVLAGLERSPADRIAICPFGPATASTRLGELLDAAGITWSGRPSHPLASTVSGRVLLALLDLDGERWSIDAVLRVLSAGPIRRHLDAQDPEVAPAARWGVLARAANVVATPGQWRDRLAVLHRDLRARHDEAAAADVAELAGFIASLYDLLHPQPLPSDWTEASEWLSHLLETVLVAEDFRTDAASRDAIASLAGLDTLAGRPTPDIVRSALGRALSGPVPRRGLVGAGVLIADPADLVGATFDLLLVTGLVEGAAPRRSIDDPLLPDADRATRRIEERAALLGAIASSTTSIVSTHRADHQAERRPSRWVLDWAGRRAHLPRAQPVTARDLLTGSGPCAPDIAAEWLTIVPSFAAAVTAPERAANDQEAALASISEWCAAGSEVDGHPLLVAGSPLARSVTCIRARRSDRFTIWDGLLERSLPFADAMSATNLETWADCPRKHFLQHILKIVPTKHPEDQLGLDGLERGSLAHAALHHVVRRRVSTDPPNPPLPGEPWNEIDIAALRRAVRDGAERLRRDGRLGGGTIARLRQDELEASLLNVLSDDDVDRAEGEWIPVAAELSFEAVPVDLPASGPVHFRGRIDRVDRSDDGARFRVIDYKTGQGNRQLRAQRNGAAAARLLQLSIYERAIRHLHPDITQVDALWWLVDRRPAPMRVPNALTPALFEEALDAIVTGIRGGVFPADPGEDRGGSWATCTYCPYDRICAADRDDAIERKLSDPVLEPFVALRRVGEAVAETDPGESGGSNG